MHTHTPSLSHMYSLSLSLMCLQHTLSLPPPPFYTHKHTTLYTPFPYTLSPIHTCTHCLPTHTLSHRCMHAWRHAHTHLNSVCLFPHSYSVFHTHTHTLTHTHNLHTQRNIFTELPNVQTTHLNIRPTRNSAVQEPRIMDVAPVTSYVTSSCFHQLLDCGSK